MSRRGNSKAVRTSDREAPSPAPAVSPAQLKPAAVRRDAARAEAAVRSRNKNLRRILVIGLVLAALGSLIYFNTRRGAALPGQAVPQMVSRHLSPTDPTPIYETDPPTSGPHVAGPAAWGVFTTEQSKAAVVHSLEDGGVVINYRPDIDSATLGQLSVLAKSYDTDHLILAPYAGLSDPIVLTAWNRIDRLAAWEEDRIRRFVDAWSGQDHHAESGS